MSSCQGVPLSKWISTSIFALLRREICIQWSVAQSKSASYYKALVQSLVQLITLHLSCKYCYWYISSILYPMACRNKYQFNHTLSTQDVPSRLPALVERVLCDRVRHSTQDVPSRLPALVQRVLCDRVRHSSNNLVSPVKEYLIKRTFRWLYSYHHHQLPSSSATTIISFNYYWYSGIASERLAVLYGLR